MNRNSWSVRGPIKSKNILSHWTHRDRSVVRERLTDDRCWVRDRQNNPRIDREVSTDNQSTADRLSRSVRHIKSRRRQVESLIEVFLKLSDRVENS